VVGAGRRVESLYEVQGHRPRAPPPHSHGSPSNRTPSLRRAAGVFPLALLGLPHLKAVTTRQSTPRPAGNLCRNPLDNPPRETSSWRQATLADSVVKLHIADQ
jgi:hypothetical protein